jgi:hypothetical protein
MGEFAMNAPERIGLDPVAWYWTRDPHETDHQYIRADLHRAEVEAAVKRALEAAAEKARAYCHFRTIEGRALKSPAVFTTHTGQDLSDAFRALASDPEALRCIVEGGE